MKEVKEQIDYLNLAELKELMDYINKRRDLLIKRKRIIEKLSQYR